MIAFFRNTIFIDRGFIFRAIITVTTLYAAFFGGLGYAHAQSATLYVSPASGTHSIGETFSVNVMTDSGTSDVNASEAALAFDSSVLRVQKISKDDSALNLWTQDPTFSNSGGTISFGGGSTASFSGKKIIMTIVFEAKAAGIGNVSFSSGNMLASDGKGTDILSGTTGGSYTITEGAPAVEKKEDTYEEATAYGGASPRAPEITSSTHEKDKWSNKTAGTFTWDVPNGITAVRLLFDEEPDSSPTVEYSPPIAEREIKDMEDGISYLHVALKNAAGWGESSHRKIMIDTAPPSEFTVAANERQGPLGPEIVLSFPTTTDELSGIDNYEISVDGGVPITVLPEEVIEGEYIMPPQDGGVHTAVIAAIDKAGNRTEANVGFTSTAAAVVAKNVEEEEDVSKADIRYWMSVLFAGLAAFMFAYLIYERRRMRRERQYIKNEATEAWDRIGAIFPILREDVQEQVRAMIERQNLTESDRSALEEIGEAIDISEELIEKEVDDIRKLL